MYRGGNVHIHYQQAFRALILGAFSAMLFHLHWTDKIVKYVNPKYEHLSMTAASLFAILFFVQLTRVFVWNTRKQAHDDHACCTHDHGQSAPFVKKLITYTIIITPILTGFFLPAQVLNAAMADKKGGVMVLTNQQTKVEDYLTEDAAIVDDIYAEHEPDTGLLDGRKEMKKDDYEQLKEELSQKPIIQMTDDNYTIYYGDINADYANYIGRKIQIKGFVLKEESFAQNQLVISRFLITHCIADASVVGFLSELPEAQNLEEDTWIEVMGTIDTIDFDGSILPIIKIEQWVEIQEPLTPYLYPIDVFVSTS